MEELINGRTPEEIITGLKCEVPCSKCAYKEHNFMKDDSCSYYIEPDIIALINHLEAQQPKWISVKERLPKDGELVLITMNGEIDGYKQFDHAYELAYYWSEGEDEDGEYHVAGWALWDYREGRVSDIEVFYWMPLPEPPEEEG